MVRIREGVSCERVGDHWLVLCNPDGVVHNLTGPAATVLDCVTTDQPIPTECTEAVDALVDTGVLTGAPGWSRRKILTTAAAAAAAGITTAVLPTASAAASPI